MITQNSIKKFIKESLVIILGSLILAFSISFCFINYKGIHIFNINENNEISYITFNGILTGGTSGFSLIIRNLFFLNIENGGMITENIISICTVVLFIVGALFLGKKFAIHTLVSTITFPVFIYLFRLHIFDSLHSQFDRFDPILCAIIGGILMGVGCGITYKVGGSTGGFDVPGMIINKYSRIKLSILFFIQDGILVALAFIAKFSLYEIFIGLISVISYSSAVELVQRLGNEAYFCDIISDHWEEINKEILALDRGTTIVDVIGGYTNTPRKMIKTMVGKNQYLDILDVVKKIDPTAFISMSKTHDVFGEGYIDLSSFSNK